MSEIRLEKIDDYRWLVPLGAVEGMNVPGLIYADDRSVSRVSADRGPEQVANVACLPGIVERSLAMPDIHWGYGFPIGGVAATDPEAGGVISPGGVGYDINCGVRLVRTDLTLDDVQPRIEALTESLFSKIPCGVGSSSGFKLSRREQESLLSAGASWAVKRGYGSDSDVQFTEGGGRMDGADPSRVSVTAMERGYSQHGTLGSGNHFIELQAVEEVYDEEKARDFGLFKGQVGLMIHCGSRGLGHQVCDDYLKVAGRAMAGYGIRVPDRQLACVPVNSSEGRDYFGAMCAAANYAWANRQFIMHAAMETIGRVLGASPEKLGMRLVYDVAHNIAKMEKHRGRTLCVHRKGATRAFPPGHPELPPDYRRAGQPVLIPGDMGRRSYVLAGCAAAMEETWGSTCHGAGRLMSRHAAVKAARGRSIAAEMREKGIIVRARGRNTLAEESSEAYKDVDSVVSIVHNAGLSKRVAKLKPLAVVKG